MGHRDRTPDQEIDVTITLRIRVVDQIGLSSRYAYVVNDELTLLATGTALKIAVADAIGETRIADMIEAAGVEVASITVRAGSEKAALHYRRGDLWGSA